MRKGPVLLVAFVLAATAFWATMLTKPPVTQASAQLSTMSIQDLAIPPNLPIADQLDTF
jgi:hypothetical protein